MGLGLALDVAIRNSTARVFKGLTLATLVHFPNNLGAKSVPSATGTA